MRLFKRLFKKYKVVWRWLYYECNSGRKINLLPIPFFYKREDIERENANADTGSNEESADDKTTE